MRNFMLSMVLASLAMPAMASIHPSKQEKEALAAGAVAGVLFNKPLAKATKASAKAGAKAAKASAKHLFRFATFRR